MTFRIEQQVRAYVGRIPELAFDPVIEPKSALLVNVSSSVATSEVPHSVQDIGDDEG
jgi:hypothetical protein